MRSNLLIELASVKYCFRVFVKKKKLISNIFEAKLFRGKIGTEMLR